MKRLLAALLLPVAMLTTPCEALSPEAADDRPSRLRVAAFLMPPLIEGTTAAPSGPFVDYLRRIEALSGVAMDVTMFDSPQRAAEAMATGRFDAVAPSVRTPERERHLAFGEPLAKLPVAILTSRPAVREAVTIADLAGKRVAVAIPSFVDAAMAHAQPEALYVRLASPEEALTSVALGNADYAVVELAHATRLAARIGLPNLHVVGRVPFFYEPAIGIRHDAPPAFKAAVLSATAAMTSDERERLLHGWLTESEIARQPDDGHRIALGVAGASALLLLAAYGLHRRRLRRQTEIYDMLASNIDDIVTVRRNDARRTFLYGSPSLSRLTGFSMRELAAAQLAQLLHPDDLAAFREHRARIDRGDALATVTHRLRRKDGSWLWLETRSKVYRRPNGNIDRVVSLSRDITERRQTEERIRHLACHDPLTDLPNRVAVTQHLQAAIARARTVGRSLALCCLDADSFKHVNDSRGHAAGDATLRAVAMRLRDRSAPDAFIARLGGDEFVVLHENLAVESEADTAAAGLAHLFVEPLMVDGEPVYLTVSVGVALHPQHAATADALLAAADTAMYAAKTAGRNTWRRFSGEMGALLQRRAEALQQLRQAYEQKRLLLHYQPKIDLASGRCVGVEALLRVQTAQGIRGPAGLIEAAEESGFISTLGDWVIETAMAQSRAWRHDGITLPIAVNVSTRQLQDPRFIAWMQEQVQRDPQLPALLDLEITESALASDARAANDALTALHGVGFRLSVDDFGTGYSSLAYLAKMPVQTLKIDRSFVAGLPDAHDSREIVRAVIALARAMQLAVIAEGVETAEQAAFLHEAGCEQAQGYLFARPGPAAQAAEFFAASGAATAKVANLAAFRIQSGR